MIQLQASRVVTSLQDADNALDAGTCHNVQDREESHHPMHPNNSHLVLSLRCTVVSLVLILYSLRVFQRTLSSCFPFILWPPEILIQFHRGVFSSAELLSEVTSLTIVISNTFKRPYAVNSQCFSSTAMAAVLKKLERSFPSC